MITKSTFILTILLIFTASTLFAQSASFAYKSEDENSSIIFPESYEIKKEVADEIKTVKISSTFEGMSFFVSYTIHIVPIINHSEMCELSLEGFKETLEGTIKKKSNWLNSGNEGIQAIITFSEEENSVDYRVIFNDNVQYQIVVAGTRNDWKPEIAKTFFDSFNILKN